jgi:hypothetical protein
MKLRLLRRSTKSRSNRRLRQIHNRIAPSNEQSLLVTEQVMRGTPHRHFAV